MFSGWKLHATIPLGEIVDGRLWKIVFLRYCLLLLLLSASRWNGQSGQDW
jgi:hypothetical protein